MRYIYLIPLMLCVAFSGCGKSHRVNHADLRQIYLPEQERETSSVAVFSESVVGVKPSVFYIEGITKYDSEIKFFRREDQVVRALESLGWRRTINLGEAEYVIGWRSVEGSYSERSSILSVPISGISYDRYLGFYSRYLGTRTETVVSTSYLYGITLIGHGVANGIKVERFYVNGVIVGSEFSPEDIMPFVICGSVSEVGRDNPRGRNIVLTQSKMAGMIGLDAPPLRYNELLNSVLRKCGAVRVTGVSGHQREVIVSELFKIGIQVLDDSKLPEIQFTANESGYVRATLKDDDVIVSNGESGPRKTIGGFDSGDPYLNAMAEILIVNK